MFDAKKTARFILVDKAAGVCLIEFTERNISLVKIIIVVPVSVMSVSLFLAALYPFFLRTRSMFAVYYIAFEGMTHINCLFVINKRFRIFKSKFLTKNI